MNKDIKTCIKELRESPLFALSKCSNELAHTNFWAWLIEECIKDGKNVFVEVFIPGFYEKGYVFSKVTREEGHRDLTIYYERDTEQRGCHIVENKIKSIPTETQLEDYKNNVENTFFGGTLTGITKTLDKIPDGYNVGDWGFVDYETIASNIEKQLKQFGKDYVHREVIEQYIQDIRNISGLITKEIENTGEKYKWKIEDIDKGNEEEIEKIKMGDILLKQLGCQFAKEVQERINKEGEDLRSTWGKPFVNNDFNNKKATITVVYKESDGSEELKNKEEIGRFGIQIEGDQFRLYGGPGSEGKKYKKHEDLFNELKKRNWLQAFDAKADTPTIRGNKTAMRGGRGKHGKLEYCRYTGSNYTHIYQYWDIEENNREDLCNDIIEYLKEAKQIIDTGLSFR